jgi:hypothetical protein
MELVLVTGFWILVASYWPNCIQHQGSSIQYLLRKAKPHLNSKPG